MQGGGAGGLHQPRTVCLPHAMTYSLFWFLPGTTSNLMEVSPIPWFLVDKADSRQHRPEMASTILPKPRLPSQKGSLRTPASTLERSRAGTPHLLRHSWRIW